MNWQQLLPARRLGQNNTSSLNSDDRSQFQRDYDRIIFSAPFRRLQNKTQVFPLPGSVFVHNRLTHSLEVASIGRSLAHVAGTKLTKLAKLPDNEMVADMQAIVSAACLAHDLGNPPFGHSGEDAIRRYFTESAPDGLKDDVTHAQWSDWTRFEGNANAFRALTHRFNGRREGGFALTYATLAALVKYPYSSDAGLKKFGFFESERPTFMDIASKTNLHCLDAQKQIFARHPLVYLVEAADDIAYLVMDIEDAHRLGIFSKEKVFELFSPFFDEQTQNRIRKNFEEVTDRNEQVAYLRSVVINTLVQEAADVFVQYHDKILSGTFSDSLIDYLSDTRTQALKHCRDFSTKEIYNHRSVVEVELTGFNVLRSLLAEFVPASLNPDTAYSRKLLALIPSQFEIKNDYDVYARVQSVLDFISGMTDLYAMDVYRIIRGIGK
jgi:dGTPase